MADYIIQKAVNADAVKKKLRKTLEEYAATRTASHKYDGCCAILRNGRTYSRTGELYQCLDGIAEDPCWEGLVPVGEAWWPGKDQFSRISGEFRRFARSGILGFMVHDVLTEAEFAAGHSAVPKATRMARVGPRGHRWEKVFSYPAGTYGDPQAMCNRLVELGGYDGLILDDPNGTWTAGRGTTGETVKIKRVLSYDLRVLEVNTVTGAKTGRAVHKLVVSFNGKRLGVGSGVPHDIKDCPTVGQIVEVEAMDLSSEGLLREPRFKGIRFDKLEADG